MLRSGGAKDRSRDLCEVSVAESKLRLLHVARVSGGFLALVLLLPPSLSGSLSCDLRARLFGLIAAARATPRLRPPSRPSATAAGFFGRSVGGSVFGACPADSSMIRYASWFGSRGRVFERSGITPPVW